MNEDRIAGTARNMGGKVQEGFGRVTGDAKSQADGLINQAAGAAQDLHGQTKETASDAAQVDARAPSTLRTMSAVSLNNVQSPRLSQRFVSAGLSVACDGGN
jgi:uncharacterized protein YjbJ (UPF0337 family)